MEGWGRRPPEAPQPRNPLRRRPHPLGWQQELPGGRSGPREGVPGLAPRAAGYKTPPVQGGGRKDRGGGGGGAGEPLSRLSKISTRS